MKPKIHKLSLDDFFEEDFHLIALYSQEEDYRMAFLLNYYLDLHLVKAKSIRDAKTGIDFSVFEFKDKTHYRTWYLIHNYQLVTQKKLPELGGLFLEQEPVTQKPVYYVKELFKAKFLLKIEAEEPDEFYENLIKTLNGISQIYTSELVHLQRLKDLDLLKF